MLNAPMSWCKFGVTLYRAIFTIFTISNGTLKTPRDNYFFMEFQRPHFGGVFVILEKEPRGTPRSARRACPPPSHGRLPSPAHARLGTLPALGGFAAVKTIDNRFRLATQFYKR